MAETPLPPSLPRQKPRRFSVLVVQGVVDSEGGTVWIAPPRVGGGLQGEGK